MSYVQAGLGYDQERQHGEKIIQKLKIQREKQMRRASASLFSVCCFL
jgi:hypothetical protein